MSNNKPYEVSTQNAEAIIERFGGIRPMATKIQAAVTTVQGWKKRNTIPPHRLDKIIEAAQAHDIDLSDLVEYPDHLKPKPAEQEAPQATETKTEPTQPAIAQPEKPAHAPKPEEKTSEKPDQQPSRNRYEDMKDVYQSSLHDDIIYTITQAERRAVEKSRKTSLILVGISTVALALIFGLQSGGKSDHQRKAELKTMQAEMQALKSDMDALKDQSGTLVNTKPTLDERAKKASSFLANEAKVISNTLLNGASEEVSAQVQALEKTIDGLGRFPQIASITQRFAAFTKTSGGQNLLDQSTDELSSILGGLNSTDDKTISKAIDQARQTSASLNQSLEGVPQDDLKAAAMLLAMTQLRSTLNRDNEPFTNDLELLQSLVGEENAELQGSIQKLAPHAQGGILTSHGLSNELRSLTGEVVVASLKGEKLSIADRAKARVNSALLRESNSGQVVAGSKAQETLSAADTLLKQGNVQGAIAEVQKLDGPAAKIAAPWLDKAQASLAAQNLKTSLSGVLDAKSAGLRGFNTYKNHGGSGNRPIYLRPN